MRKLTLDLDALTVEAFDTSEHPFVMALDTGTCPDTFQTTGGPWLCAADCGSLQGSCTC